MIESLDLDFNDKALLERILRKIWACPWRLDGWQICESPGGDGFHVELACRRGDVCICRMVFDDQKRFYADQMRPRESQGVLWSRKRRIRENLVLEVPRC